MRTDSDRPTVPIDIEASAITRYHDMMVADPDWPHLAPAPSGGLWGWIEANHRYNTLLWDQEDKARRVDVPAGEIAECKRLIDRYNQQRNDAVEAIDEVLLDAMADVPLAGDARLNSETAGAMIDRLSILALKIVHMSEQTQRTAAGREHMANCRAKLDRLSLQRRDLALCFDQLMRDVRQGRAYFKVYRQFKMYNDPALNPYLYGGTESAAAARGL